MVAEGRSVLQLGVALLSPGDLLGAGVCEADDLGSFNPKDVRDMRPNHSATADQAESDLFHDDSSYTAFLIGGLTDGQGTKGIA